MNEQLVRAATILWDDGVASGLREHGWADEEIETWMQSRSPRWLLDGALGADLRNLGRLLAGKLRKA